jgi:hypothetical protein
MSHSLETRTIYAIEILLSIAFVSTSIALLIVGNLCFQGKGPPSNPTQCENIYISGILMSFICGCALAFGALCYIADRCEARIPAPPLSNRRQTHAPDTIVVVRQKKSTKSKSVKNPLSSHVQKA